MENYYAQDFKRWINGKQYQGECFIDDQELCKQVAHVMRKAGIYAKYARIPENGTFVERYLLLLYFPSTWGMSDEEARKQAVLEITAGNIMNFYAVGDYEITNTLSIDISVRHAYENIPTLSDKVQEIGERYTEILEQLGQLITDAKALYPEVEEFSNKVNSTYWRRHYTEHTDTLYTNWYSMSDQFHRDDNPYHYGTRMIGLANGIRELEDK